MSAETLGDVLNWTRAAHAELAKRIERSSEQASERDRMLLDYLAQHEQKLSHALEQAKKDASASALHTWCADYFTRRSDQQIELDANFEALDTREILAKVLDAHNRIVDLYRFLNMRAEEVAEAEELVDDLISLEEHEAMIMARDSQRLQAI